MTWWAAYCEARRERVAKEACASAGFDTFLPYERVKRRVRMPGGRSRLVDRDEPVFPRYLFVDAPQALRVRESRAVITVVNACGRALAVPLDVIEALRSCASAVGQVGVARDVTRLSSRLRWAVGDAFRFGPSTPLSGFVGEISSLSKLDESGVIRAWVTMLGSRREVEVSHRAVGNLLTGAAASGDGALQAALA